jgi:hypothetical protein
MVQSKPGIVAPSFPRVHGTPASIPAVLSTTQMLRRSEILSPKPDRAGLDWRFPGRIECMGGYEAATG